MAITFQTEKNQAAGVTPEVTDHSVSATFTPLPGIVISCTLDAQSLDATVEVTALGHQVANSTIGKDHPCLSAKADLKLASVNFNICVDVNAKVVTADGSASAGAGPFRHTVTLDKHVLVHV